VTKKERLAVDLPLLQVSQNKLFIFLLQNDLMIFSIVTTPLMALPTIACAAGSVCVAIAYLFPSSDQKSAVLVTTF
jgi:hypothetical protein